MSPPETTISSFTQKAADQYQDKVWPRIYLVRVDPIHSMALVRVGRGFLAVWPIPQLSILSLSPEK